MLKNHAIRHACQSSCAFSGFPAIASMQERDHDLVVENAEAMPWGGTSNSLALTLLRSNFGTNARAARLGGASHTRCTGFTRVLQGFYGKLA